MQGGTLSHSINFLSGFVRLSFLKISTGVVKEIMGGETKRKSRVFPLQSRAPPGRQNRRGEWRSE